jgi:hypothetical protein
MAMPGFNAETSLYRSRVSYNLRRASVGANGVMPQQFGFGPAGHIVCGMCQSDRATGLCAMSCTRFWCSFGWPWPAQCYTNSWTQLCDPSMCLPQ